MTPHPNSKPAAYRQSERVVFNLTPDEYQRLKDIAEANRITVSGYCRNNIRAALGLTVDPYLVWMATGHDPDADSEPGDNR